MRKTWILLTLALASGLFLASWVPYGFSSRNPDEQTQLNLATYQALLWQISPERIAAKATEFNNAIKQYDAVVRANLSSGEGNRNLAVKLTDNDYDQRAVIAEKDASGEYKVSYNPRNFDLNIPAVVVDLDETFLDNSLHGIKIALSKQGFDIYQFHEWVKAMKAPIYTNAICFAEHVWETGGIVLFCSNRNMGANGGNGTGDHLGYTRQNLIDQGYPAAFTDSYTWWLSGVLRYEDQSQGQTKENLTKLKSKEERYNYLHRRGVKLHARSMQQMNLSYLNGDRIWDDVNDNSSFSGKAKVKIVMKIGDDLDDFNSNLLASCEPTKNLEVRQNYMENDNIRQLFGGIGPAVWFSRDDDSQIVQHIAKSLRPIDQNLAEHKKVYKIILEPDPLLQTYTFISGNANYGHWLEAFQTAYGKDINGMKTALTEYFVKHGGEKIWR